MKITLASALGALFAIIIALSAFMPWATTTTILTSTTTDYSGWGIFTDDYLKEEFAYYFMPVVVLIIGALLALLFLFMPKGTASAVLTIVLSIASIALVYLTYNQLGSFIDDSLLWSALYDLSMAWGLYLAMGAGVLSILCGAVARD